MENVLRVYLSMSFIEDQLVQAGSYKAQSQATLLPFSCAQLSALPPRYCGARGASCLNRVRIQYETHTIGFGRPRFDFL